jgi:hypothetical protein
MPGNQENRTIRSETEARSGVTGHNVRYVLFWSTLAAAVAMAALYFVFVHGRT